MKIGDIYTESITIKVTPHTKEFLANEAALRNMHLATLGRDLFENVTRIGKKNGDRNAVEALLSHGFNKEALENDIQEELPASFFVKEKKTRKTREVKNSGVIYIMKLPDGTKEKTTNLLAYVKDWCKKNGREDHDKVREAIKSDFKCTNKKPTIHQRNRRKIEPYIFTKFKKVDGVFRRFTNRGDTKGKKITMAKLDKFIEKDLSIRKRKSKKNKTAVDANTCPDCRVELVLRDGEYGEFYACPKCEFTLPPKIDDDKVLEELGADTQVDTQEIQDKWDDIDWSMNLNDIRKKMED